MPEGLSTLQNQFQPEMCPYSNSVYMHIQIMYAYCMHMHNEHTLAYYTSRPYYASLA